MAKIAVIGSGFGGLATAIRLQAEGHSVTIFEKRDKPGGRAYVYNDEGFTFDAGPTVITAPECLSELFSICGRKMEDYVELMPVSPLYRLYWEDGYRFDYTNDLSSTLGQIADKSPEDVEGYREFLRYTEEVFRAGYEELAHVPFLHWSTMVRVSPELLRLKAYRSVYHMVSKFIRDPQLRQAFSFHSLLVGGNPFTSSSIYTLIHFLERKWGVFFPRGGTGAMVQALVRLFQDMGGQIYLGAGVSEIATHSGKVDGVRLGGETLPFDAVVSNADVNYTYKNLLANEPAAQPARRRLSRSRYSMSLFLVYFGTSRRYPDIAHHNVIFGARYRELLDDIFKHGRLADDFSLYLHAPSHSDPQLAREGGEAFYVLSPVPHLGNSQVDWENEGPRYADRILEYLDERYLPGLRESLVTRRIFTPLDFERQLGATHGSAFSLEPLLTQSAYFRVHNRDPRIEGLYFAGAGTHPGAGVPGVVSSAKATSSLVIEDFRKRAHSSVAIPLALKAKCRETIAVGSKSFSFAAKLFPSTLRDAAFLLYGWCRYCDDQIDEISDGALQARRVGELRDETGKAFRQEPSTAAAFQAMAHVASRYRIPEIYASELIEGMAMDARREQYRDLPSLLLYCYRVAGTVGLMMSHIMGVSDESALSAASDLGTAMQLTNIARDVTQDAERGRVYLPLSWLEEAGVSPDAIGAPENRAAVASVVSRLLAEADRYYASGNAGLKYLPWRAALACGVASSVYREIGNLVLERGAHAWDRRAVTSPARKAWAFFKGMGLVLRSIPYRLGHQGRSVPIQLIRRFES